MKPAIDRIAELILENNPWSGSITVLGGLRGSYLYGTEREGSDVDAYAVCVQPLDYYLGMQSYRATTSRRQETVIRPDERYFDGNPNVEMVYWDVKNYLMQLHNGAVDPTSLLFAPSDSRCFLTRAGRRLVDNRHLFVTQEMAKGGWSWARYSKVADFEDLIRSYRIAYVTNLLVHRGAAPTRDRPIHIRLKSAVQRHRENQKRDVLEKEVYRLLDRIQEGMKDLPPNISWSKVDRLCEQCITEELL